MEQIAVISLVSNAQNCSSLEDIDDEEEEEDSDGNKENKSMERSKDVDEEDSKETLPMQITTKSEADVNTLKAKPVERTPAKSTRYASADITSVNFAEICRDRDQKYPPSPSSYTDHVDPSDACEAKSGFRQENRDVLTVGADQSADKDVSAAGKEKKKKKKSKGMWHALKKKLGRKGHKAAAT